MDLLLLTFDLLLICSIQLVVQVRKKSN